MTRIGLMNWKYDDIGRLKMEKINRYVERDALMSVQNPKFKHFEAILLVEYFQSPERGNEPMIALQINLMNPFIKKVVLFQNEKQDLTHLLSFDKIQSVVTSNRLTIGEMYEYGSDRYPNHMIMLSNNDIYFDNTLIHLQTMKNRELFTISRQHTIFGDVRNLTIESPPNTFFNNFCTYYFASHDVFAVRPPIDKGILEELKKAYLGEWGTDNYINQVFLEGNWTLSNPCNDILVRHLHSVRSEQRDVKKRVLGEVYGKFGIQFPPFSKYEMEITYEVPVHYWNHFFDTLGKNNKKH